MNASSAAAMVFTAPGAPLVRRNFALPTLQPGELLVKIIGCTLCGSDVHTYTGRRATPCPTILGHEILGRVAALPPDDPPRDAAGRVVQIGDRVTFAIAAHCGRCEFCLRGLPQKCRKLFKYGHQVVDDAHVFHGGLAEYCHLRRGTTVVQVPTELPDEVICPASCATATAAAVLRTAELEAGQTVVVIGAGMLGLTAAAMARVRRAAAVFVSDLQPERAATALRFGADEAVADVATLRSLVLERTVGLGADVALEMSGAPEGAELALDLLRVGGRLVLAGAVYPARPLQLDGETVVRRMLRLEGVHNYRPEDLVSAVGFLRQSHRAYPWAELVTRRFLLDEADVAFQHAAGGRHYRVWVGEAATS